MTQEEMQARILELEDENKTLKADKEKLSEDNNTLTKDLENARAYNTELFNRVRQQDTHNGGKHNEDEESVSCVDFAVSIADKF